MIFNSSLLNDENFLILLPLVILGLVNRISRDERQRTPLGLGQI